jgi:2-oxoglutarate dehydrogenase E2 component (dihydrolipoamide succinyltransferase)
MLLELKVPSPGESITEVEIANWLKKDGDIVSKDEELCEIDSDKATLTINADQGGKLSIKATAGQKVNVGDVVATIDTSFAGAEAPKAAASAVEVKKEAAPAVTSKPVESPAPVASTANYAAGVPSPAAAKIMSENGIKSNDLAGSGPNGRITKGDVLSLLANGFGDKKATGNSREQKREKMTSLRRKLSQRLVSVKNETAMLTTFNEVDMTNVMQLRKDYKDKFKEAHNIGLGFMSFFTKAVTIALQKYPAVNAMIDGEEIVTHNYCDVGIAVSAPKGLMVPVIRNAENMSLAEIEKSIATLAVKARDGKISVDEMTGGTFTITNGGVFGSMLSTPIINPPQSAILGMHNIVERPMAVNGKVEIRPIMYVALSYDHRIIDGRESVGFLYTVKELIENPKRMLFNGKKGEEVLLGL